MATNTKSRLVTLSPGGKQFTTQPNNSVLESGLSAGIALPFSCANGTCGDCRAKVITGSVVKLHFHDFALTEAEKLSGICLLCANAAKTDVTIEAREASSAQDIPHQKLRGKLCFRSSQSDVTILRFKLSRGKALRFLPGQYVTVTTQAGDSMSLPIANCPCDPDYLEFHIPPNPGPPGSNLPATNNRSLANWCLDHPGSRTRIDIEGPHGNFTLHDSDQRDNDPLTFVAIGSGFATIKPMLEHVISLENETPCQLIWIATKSITHYMNNLCRSWNDAFDSFNYVALNAIESFDTDALKLSGTTNKNVGKIYVSGDRRDSQQIKHLLENAGVPPGAIVTDLTTGT